MRLGGVTMNKNNIKQAGKGDAPRNNSSEEFRQGYDSIEGFSFKPWWQREEKEEETCSDAPEEE